MSGETEKFYQEMMTGTDSGAMREEHARFFDLPRFETEKEYKTRTGGTGD